MSNVPNWNDLLPTIGAIESMAPEQLQRVDGAIEQYSITLGFGIAAIGNLLACTASNGQTGLNDQTATDIGWLLESLGELSARLADTGNAVSNRRRTLKPRA
ncbi:hypothetical protein [Stutzerimonas stutzeri]|uniref:hypothetical protein n=1 Tax=Stutzerimonas stutzeri TaxID=316 RepID=UPI000F795C55|nr:hypothetical protein [Stutzerimonas stutzeri]RRW08263.1 hypothetical protein EGJ32_04185 [Stutzerimonas stutzeri]